MEKAIEMKNICKEYPLVKALDDVDFSLASGEIHSLLGENGAGKSTLMKILYGMNYPYKGDIFINGKKMVMKNPRMAIENGISMVHQHFMLVPVMSVAENIVIGREPKKSILFDRKKAEEEIDAMIKHYGFNISAKDKIESLSVGEQQRVEILKAMYGRAQIIILDEPTAVLTPQEVDELFKIMKKLKEEGKTIVIITHKLRETLSIADRVSVLRDGRMIEKNISIKEVTKEKLANLMVGRDVQLGITRPAQKIGEKSFEVKNLNLVEKGRKVLDEIHLTLHKGEILGIAGIEGNGQSELLEVLTGVRQDAAMTLQKDGKEIKGDAKDFINKKIGHIPEDRTTQGLVTEMSVMENLILGYQDKNPFSKNGFLKKKEIYAFAENKINDFMIKAPNPRVGCNKLSGGNQQKVVIARIFSQEPDVIIVAQPTRGVDIGAMEYIHTKLLDLRDEGKAILLVSADLEEIRCLSDRIAVIYEGKIVTEVKQNELTEAQLGLFMTGGNLSKGGEHVEN